MHTSPEFLLCTTLAILFVSLVLIRRFFSSSDPRRMRNKQPPSPRRLPLIGNLHNLGRHPHRSLHRLSLRYGPLMLLRFGSVPVIIVSSIDAAQEVTKTHDLAFADRPKFSIFRKLFYDHKDIATSPCGEYWRQIKAISVMHLLSTTKVKSFRHVREEETAVMMGKIGEASVGSVPINLSEAFATLTYSVASRVVLGRKSGDGNFKRLFGEVGKLIGCVNVGDYIKWLGWVSFVSGTDAKVERVRKEIDEFLDGVVDEHLKRRKLEEGLDEDGCLEKMDFVDVLLWIQRKNLLGFPLERDCIKALILDNFGGGIDTTKTLLEWAMTELLRHPNTMRQLQNAVRRIGGERSDIMEEDLGEMQYLRAVIKETLRLHPPIPFLVRRLSNQDVNLQGYHVAAGSQVIVNVWSIGRDPSSWERPEEFLPERFLMNSSSIDYSAFGSGRRSCPGVSYAMMMSELALANIVHRFDWRVAKGGEARDLDMTESVGIPTHRKLPLILVANEAANPPVQGLK